MTGAGETPDMVADLPMRAACADDSAEAGCYRVQDYTPSASGYPEMNADDFR